MEKSGIRFMIIMGVSGSGKTAVGKALAAQLGWAFFDGSDYHPPEYNYRLGSVHLEESGPTWLDALHSLIEACLAAGQPGIMAVSVLTEAHRQRLLQGSEGVQVVFLKGSGDLITARKDAKKMKPGNMDLVRDQLDILEEPADAWVVDISPPVDEIVEKITERLADAS